ncbi:MAG TPA: orotidine 5'-phosphate decarboxylase / HUMPS family protein [Acidimicrobiia bacterium]|nr:orotidine 5'-phosphate decarboxylase / HUMPS family protein [Acidimicrobiia bacterium]
MGDRGLVALLTARIAGEAVREADQISGAVDGFAVGADLLLGPGPGVVGALARIGEVTTLFAIHGTPEIVGRAAGRLAEYGARRIAVHALVEEGAMEAAVVAAAASGATVVAASLDSGIDDARAASLGLGGSRGAVVSRLAKRASAAGASGVLATLADLGVVAQAAPELGRVAVGISSLTGIDEARQRGADLIVVPSGLVGGITPVESQGA